MFQFWPSDAFILFLYGGRQEDCEDHPNELEIFSMIFTVINTSLDNMVLYLYKANPDSNPANGADVARDLLREDVEAAFSVDFHRSLRKRI